MILLIQGKEFWHQYKNENNEMLKIFSYMQHMHYLIKKYQNYWN